MHANEAVSVLKNLAYKPGWRFDAMAYEGMAQYEQMLVERSLGMEVPHGTVLFHYVIETVDTDREYAMGGYSHPKRLTDTVPFNAADFEDPDDLLFEIFNLIMQLEEHEAKEFFRCKDRDWHAPFHPHRPEGEQLWEFCAQRIKTN